MLIASLFLLWIIVILLVVAVVALTRQVRLAQSHLQLRSAPLAIRSAPVGPGGVAPVISMPTLAGDMLTVGGVSADGRAQLLLFIGPGCPASRTAVRNVLARTDRARLRLLFLGEGRAEDYGDMLRQHRIRATDMILNMGIGADYSIDERPAAALIDAQGRLLARGPAATREQIDALLAHVQRPVAETDGDDVAAQLVTSAA